MPKLYLQPARAEKFSEFGRRVKENQGGTDHGTAAPVMFFGPALEGNGILGDNPDLGNLDNNGNLKHGVDFRSVYATILESWLCIGASAVDSILGNVFERLPDLGLQCTGVFTTELPLQQNIQHGIRYLPDGSFLITYETGRPAIVQVEIYTILGQKISTLVNAYQDAGKHETVFTNQYIGLSAAMYLYVIRSGATSVNGKFMVK